MHEITALSRSLAESRKVTNAKLTNLLRRERRRLEEEYGWTLFAPRIFTDYARREVVLRGEFLSFRLINRAKCLISNLLPDGWCVRDGGAVWSQDEEWRLLIPGITRLWRQRPGFAQVLSLSSELEEGDGPVFVITECGESRLVGAVDGTLGWTTERIGPSVPPPILNKTRRSGTALEVLLRSFCGIRYVLGGTTSSGIDCSGLVQRFYRRAFRAVLPRHSGDQFRWAPLSIQRGWQTGDLIFAKNSRNSLHVGLVLVEESAVSVVHASFSRGLVIEETFSEFSAEFGGQIWRIGREDAIRRYSAFIGKSVIDLNKIRGDHVF